MPACSGFFTTFVLFLHNNNMLKKISDAQWILLFLSALVALFTTLALLNDPYDGFSLYKGVAITGMILLILACGFLQGVHSGGSLFLLFFAAALSVGVFLFLGDYGGGWTAYPPMSALEKPVQSAGYAGVLLALKILIVLLLAYVFLCWSRQQKRLFGSII
jgi:hypothetical protein